MKDLIVVGDSFCSEKTLWPLTIAKHLNLNLICYGASGQPWWNYRNFFIQQNINNAEVIVFVHTNAERIPTLNDTIGKINHAKSDTSIEIEKAVQLYYKYIQEPNFLIWAEKQWFYEINKITDGKKVIHLHSFPWSINNSSVLNGTNIITNLAALSLNEIGANTFDLFTDQRSNHFNIQNNQELATQLIKIIQTYQGNNTLELDYNKFSQKTTRWLTDWN